MLALRRRRSHAPRSEKEHKTKGAMLLPSWYFFFVHDAHRKYFVQLLAQGQSLIE